MWDESALAWKMPNPFTAKDGTIFDTSTNSEGTSGIKFYLEGLTSGEISYLPKSELTGNPDDTGSLPAIMFPNVATAAINEPISVQFYIYQEKLKETSTDSGYWYGWNFSNYLLYTYEFDTSIEATNPESVYDLILGNEVTFTSDLTLSSPEQFTSDTIWQVSYDGGTTYADIEDSASDTNGQQANTQSLHFTPDYTADGALYRLKVTPRGEANGNSLYTEPATLTFFKYNVLFDSTGGSSVDSQAVYPQQYAIQVDSPIKSGYIFQGWYTDQTYTTQWDFEHMPVTENLTLYALWEEDPDPTSTPTNSPTPTPTESPVPTDTPAPTITPTATTSPAPTATASPTTAPVTIVPTASPTKTTTQTTSVKTGDEANAIFYLAIGGIALLGCIGVIGYRKMKSKY
ncbi:MAG: InlB B-repeat-containing protein [Dysgonomonas sp.]